MALITSLLLLVAVVCRVHSVGNECTDGTHTCDTNAACEDTVGSFTCTCNDGYSGTGQMGDCTDVNECTDGSDNCDTNAACMNTVGSFTCTCNDGYSGTGQTCTDVNECTDGSNNCDTNAACMNTVGSFTCTCNDGYSGTGQTCTDVNECTDGSDNCDTNAACMNTVGSFTCTCNNGYSGTGQTCTDVNECTDGSNNCDTNAACMNTVGSFTCTCNNGYSGTGQTCTDVNECTDGSDNCDTNAACMNTVGSFTCTCNNGYSGTGQTCTDVNECTDGSDNCDTNAACMNTVGSFTCTCNNGYSGTGQTCTDVNECTDGSDNCDTNAACMNTVGSFTCTCNNGYSGTGQTCTDVNECTDGSDNCDTNAACMNTVGSFTCTCNNGYSGTGQTCTDVNECTDGSDNCDTNAACMNTVGSFTCTCNDGYSGTGQTCTVCSPDKYGSQCMSDCTCVSSATCNNVDGQCTCTKPFPEATCDKSELSILSFMPQSGSSSFDDTAGQDDVILECQVNLDDSELTSVKVQYPDPGGEFVAIYAGSGLYRHTVSDVHPSFNGIYTCTAETTIPDSSVVSDESTYTLTVVDVNECTDGSHTCDTNATCTNTVGGFTCMCNNGYSGTGQMNDCTDINECDTNAHTCDTNAYCTNEAGSFTCTCNDGYSGSGQTGQCTKCVEGTYGFGCQQTCTCVAQVPGMNDVMCNNVDGTCTCNEEFPGKTCDRRDVTISLVPDPNPVLDTAGTDDVVWKCSVNLHSRDIVGVVLLTYLDNTGNYMVKKEEGLYEYTIYDATQDDNGVYMCTVTPNGMQAVMTTFDLDVLVVGRIISVSEPTEGRLNEMAVISCTVYATSGATITWLKGANESVPITENGKYTIEETTDAGALQQISSLSVHQLVDTDNGTYVCKVENSLNTDVDLEDVLIIVIEKPVIAGTSLTPVSSSELTAMWAIVFDGNLDPPSCSVESRLTGGDWVTSAGSPVTGETHTVTTLLPYTYYEVRIICTNKVGASNEVTVGSARTLQSNPTEPRYLNASNIQAESFTVTWGEPETKNGPIDRYVVNVTTETGVFVQQNIVVDTQSQVTKLKPFTNYHTVVTAINSEQGQDLAGPASAALEVKTGEAAPSSPMDVQSVNQQDSCEVTWDRPDNENGIIRKYRIYSRVYSRSVTGTSQQHEKKDVVEINAADPRAYSFSKSQLAAFSEYEFTVSAVTVSEGTESAVSNGSCITNAAAPPPIMNAPQSVPSNAEKETITANTFLMKVDEVSSRNGPISCYDIIVKEVVEGEDVSVLDPDVDFPQNEVTDFATAREDPSMVYVAFVTEGKSVNGTFDVTIGAGRVSRCPQSPSSRRRRQAVYDHTGDNGDLKPETTYSAFVRAYVKLEDGSGESYSSSPFMKPVKTMPGPSLAGTIIGIILAFLIITVLVLGALIYIKRKQPMPLLRYQENGVAMEPMKEKEPEFTHMVVLPTPVEALPDLVKQKSQNDDEIFKNEFKSIPESTGEVTKQASREDYNKEKNRYINIVAYDDTRVRLTPEEGVVGSDYINACFVDGYEKPRKFIASQGPREDTVLDFWRMIWEQNCCTIIMLTKCLENGREKCAEYWPEEDAIMYDDIIVTLDDVVTCADYVIRKFTMQKSIESEEDEEPIVGERRTLMQFHFLGWPDFGIPKYPHSMLCFVKRIRHMVGGRTEPGNIVVHCSAGVGRTGTYILIDWMLDMMKKEKKVDIYNVIYKIRSQRNLLVQSLVQYMFIHKALSEEYLYGHTEVDVGSVHAYYHKLCAKKEDDLSGVDSEYRAVASLPVENTDQKTGNLEPNKQKNRLRQVIPYDRNRVKLERLTGQEHSNYINASFIDGYEHKKAYVAAQGPLPNTMGDFWRLVWENQCSTIVMLTQCEEKGQNVCSKYWPGRGETENHAFLTVTVKEEKELEEYTIRDLEVSTSKGAGTKLIRQYHYHGWPEVGSPVSSAALIKVIGLSHDYQQDIGRFPILVHCSAGSGRTGVFITLSYLLQRAKAEGIVDVFQSVRALRQQRPHMVQDVAQYQFCYKAILEYLDSFEHYANFK